MATLRAAGLLLIILLLPGSVLPFATPPLLGPSQCAQPVVLARPSANVGGLRATAGNSPDAEAGLVGRRALFTQRLIPSVLAALVLVPDAAGAEVRVGAVSWPAAAGAPMRSNAARGGLAASTNAAAAAAAGAEKVRAGVRDMCAGDVKRCASILRVAFHDAIARDTVTREGGANGSIRFELERRENYGVEKGLALLKGVHAYSGLSWADTIAIAGSEAVFAAGGPRVPVATGRVDADRGDPLLLKEPVGTCREATVPGGGRDCRGQADSTMPNAGLDSDGLRNFFHRLDFSDEEIVALMGGHTLGRWTSLLGVPKECLKNLNSKWERCLPYGERLPFVSEDPDTFSNSYFKWLLLWNERKIEYGDVHFIPTDVVLVIDDGFREYVQRFAGDKERFYAVWQKAYTKLVSIGM